MIIILLGGLFLAGASVALVARAVAMPRVRAAHTLDQIGTYGFSGHKADEKAGGRSVWAGLDGLATLLGGLAAKRLGSLRESELRNELMAAGLYSTTPRKFVGYRMLALVLLGSFCAVLAGWTAPLSIVRNRARRRLERIDYELPELIDLLIVTVEAGLGFSSSLQVAADRLEGPLGDELRLTLQEQRMGLSITESLKNMLARADTPAMRSFVRSILQGETLGVSIGDIMRTLADEMRKRRRAAAEERAQKAPIKILFPLVFLIFPAMFVVLLGPAFFSFMDAFGGG